MTSVCTNCTHEVHKNTWAIDELLFCSSTCIDGYRIKQAKAVIRRLQKNIIGLTGERRATCSAMRTVLDELEVMW